jgi:hypothetical protein
MFHDFFEKFKKGKGYSDIIYADNPAALAICRKRGYKEGEYLKGAKEYVFLSLIEVKSVTMRAREIVVSQAV